MFSTERHISRRDLGWYTLVFAVCAAVACVIICPGGGTFVRSGDAYNQHVQALAYYGMWLRDLVSSLIRGDGVPAFGLPIGYGTDVVGSLHYEAIGDPLALLSVFVPAAYAHVLHSALIFVRLYLMGVTFIAFARPTLSCSRAALLIGASSYVFCGYSVYLGFCHPFFLNPMIYLPLALLGIERLLAGRGPLPFIAAVALSCIANFYFAYMIALVVLIYLVWRLSCRFGTRHLRGTAADLGRAVGAGVLGILVAACILLPVALFFSQGARQGVSSGFDMLYSRDYYARLPAAVLSSDVGLGTYRDTFLFMGPVFLLALLSLFARGRVSDRGVKILACMLVVFLLLPVFGYIFNGFSRVQNRWSWAFSLFAAWLVSRQWDFLVASVRTRARGICVAFACVYAVAVFLLFFSYSFECSETSVRKACSLAPGFVLALMMLFAIFRSGKSSAGRSLLVSRCAVCLALLIVVTSVATSFLRDSEGFLTADELTKKIEGNPYAKLADMLDDEGGGGGFARVSYGARLNEHVTQGLSAIGYNWSLAQGELARYWSDLSIVPRAPGGGFTKFHDLDGRSALNELSGVRYLLVGDGKSLPAGAQKVEEDFSGNLDLYEDTQALPFGYTYSCELDESWYAQANAVDREQGMLEGVLVEDAGGGESGGDGEGESLPEAQVEATSRDVSYEVSYGEGVRQEESSFVVEKDGAQFTLSFAGDADAETYLQMDGLWVEGKSNSLSIKATFSSGVSNEFTYYTPDAYYYYDQHDFLVNGGYSEVPQTSATITFSKKGVYSIESLRVVCQPLSGQAEKLDALRADSLRDVDFHKAGDSASTNFITGRIEVHDVRKFLLVNLPYSDGWTAKVDGREVALYRANTMFMGLYLDPGEHEIELSYATPGARAGLAASAVGVAGTALWCTVSRRREE